MILYYVKWCNDGLAFDIVCKKKTTMSFLVYIIKNSLESVTNGKHNEFF